jgi:hypothetical protein
VLSKNPLICIPEEFDRNLKEHQKEGIKFMYKNTFADLAGEEEANIGGCILAHSMGLGKFPYVLVVDHEQHEVFELAERGNGTEAGIDGNPSKIDQPSKAVLFATRQATPFPTTRTTTTSE